MKTNCDYSHRLEYTEYSGPDNFEDSIYESEKQYVERYKARFSAAASENLASAGIAENGV